MDAMCYVYNIITVSETSGSISNYEWMASIILVFFAVFLGFYFW
jgi:hypothetical protein